MWRQWARYIYIYTQYSVLQIMSWNNMVILENCSHVYSVNEIRHRRALVKVPSEMCCPPSQSLTPQDVCRSKCLLISLAFINESLCFESSGRSQVLSQHCCFRPALDVFAPHQHPWTEKLHFSHSQMHMKRKKALNSLDMRTSNWVAVEAIIREAETKDELL